MPDDVHLLTEVQSLRSRRILRTLALVQDLSDGLMAINDVTGKLALLCLSCAAVLFPGIHCSNNIQEPVQAEKQTCLATFGVGRLSD